MESNLSWEFSINNAETIKILIQWFCKEDKSVEIIHMAMNVDNLFVTQFCHENNLQPEIEYTAPISPKRSILLQLNYICLFSTASKTTSFLR